MGISGKRTPAGEREAMIKLRMVGWSVRRVAREFGVDTKTVMRCAPLRVVVERIEVERVAMGDGEENSGAR